MFKCACVFSFLRHAPWICRSQGILMRELPSQVNGAGLRTPSRRSSWVRIPPPAFFILRLITNYHLPGWDGVFWSYPGLARKHHMACSIPPAALPIDAGADGVSFQGFYTRRVPLAASSPPSGPTRAPAATGSHRYPPEPPLPPSPCGQALRALRSPRY